MSHLIRCPICERFFDPAARPALPFCSQRCRQIDLARWLTESYSVTIERFDDSEESADKDYPDDSE